MEIKKDPNYDLQTYRKLFLIVGFVISLTAVGLLFNMSQSEKKIEDFSTNQAVSEVEQIAQVEEPDQPKPEPVRQVAVTISEVLDIVSNKSTIKSSFNTLDDVDDIDMSGFGIFGPNEDEKIEKEKPPVLIADDPAGFGTGGTDEFRNWVQKNLKYPRAAEENGQQGKVILQFVVERSGDISGITVLRSSGSTDLDNAAIEQVKKSPKWTPAKTKGMPVRILVQIPVEFKLENA